MKLTVIILTVAGMILSSSVFAATIRVPSDQPTIQAGIDASVDGDTVLVADGTYTGDGNRDIDVRGKAITVASENGRETCIIDCQGTYEEKHRGFLFHTNETENTIVQGFTVQNGFGVDGGGIYGNSSSPTISNCAFSKNTATNNGCGIYLENGSNSSISNCTFTENRASLHGGGIYFDVSPNSTISNCTFTENRANSGGGIYIIGSPNSTISNCTLTENIAEYYCAGIYFIGSPNSTITDCAFSNNTAYVCGGMCFFFSQGSTISNCTFTGNIATGYYGGIEFYHSPKATISNCTFSENIAKYYCGGINFDESPNSTIYDCTFTNNTSYVCGGMYFDESPNSKVSNCTFTGNSADLDGGGIYFDVSPNSTISNCTFKANRARTGGGIYSEESPNSSISRCTFTENTTTWASGGIFIYCSQASTISNCTFTENTAQRFGAGISIFNFSDLTISNCTFTGNRSVDSGGIYVHDSSSVSISNCILWRDFPNEVFCEEVNPTVTYSLIQGGYPGIGNIDVDPLFVGGDPTDLHLSPNSLCIDAGTDQGASATDRDGNLRLRGGAVDMGAYQYPGWPSETQAYIKMPSHLFRPGDKASCIGSVWNPHEYVFDEYLFFAVLDIGGTFYCAPSYTQIDYYFQDCNPGLTEIQIIPEFNWPSGVGSVSGIVWYAGLVNPEMTELVSEIGVFDFGWGE